MKTIKEKQDEIIEEFSIFDDWMDKYEYLIDIGKNSEPLKSEIKKDEFLINGCQSRVWLVPKFENNKISFLVDSDAIITKSLAVLITGVFNNQTPADISQAKLTFIEAIGLSQNLSPTRANGLQAMIKKIYYYAEQFKK